MGKSSFVFELLKHADGAFIKPIKAIYYCYSVDQPLFTEMKKAIPNINFYKSLPKASELESWNEIEPRDKVLVIDDMMSESAKSTEIRDIYCKFAHHYRFLFVSSFPKTRFALVKKAARSVSIPTISFCSGTSDLLSTKILGRQIFGKRQIKYFLNSFERAISQKNRCLLVDLSPHSDPTYKLRTNILPGQLMTVYLPENSA